MMRLFRTITLSLLLSLALISCKTQYNLVLEGNNVNEKYKMAFELFEARKYSKAADMFESLSALTRGMPMEDTVQFYWGLSNYRYGDYITAESNLNEFIETFPVSPFVEEAKFLRIDCLYRSTYRYELDQKPTYQALTVINNFLRDNPDSDYEPRVLEMRDELNQRLELKAYKSAYLYYHMEDYMAAHHALKTVLKENADNRYREEILYYTAMSAYKYAEKSVPSKQRERYLTFVDDYFNVVGEYPETKYRKTLDGLYAKVQKFLGRTAGESETGNNQEK